MSFCFIDIFDLLDKISTKIRFVKKVHNKIQTNKNIERVKDKRKKKNIKEVQDNQQDTSKQKHWKGERQTKNK